jgi:ribosomal protein L20A (L18A)
MHKQRNEVEKSTKEMSDQIKTLLTQRLYQLLAEQKLERQNIVKILNVVNSSVDEVNNKYSKHFYKAVDELVKSMTNTGDKKSNSKSK